MNASRSFTNLGGPVLAGVLLLCVLYLASRSGYLLFHSLAEVFAIVISAAVFTLTWNTRHFTNQGYQLFVGTALLAHAKAAHQQLALDVNEQNPQALAFYKRQGFRIVGRSAQDGQGMPYPLLHMVWQRPEK